MSKKNIPYIEETYDVVVVGAGHAAVSYTHLDVYKRQVLVLIGAVNM